MPDPVIYTGPACAVIRTRTGFDVCVHAGTHSVCVGTHTSADKAIQTAQRLDRYPNKARRFAGV